MTTHTDIVSLSKLKRTVWTALFLQETTAQMFVMRYWTMNIVDTQISGLRGIWSALEIDSADRYPDSIWQYGIACRCNSCVRLRLQLWEVQSFVGFLQKMSGEDLHMPTVIDLLAPPLWTYSDICRLIALFMWYGSGPGSPISAAIGKGYIQELVSRLTKTRISEFDSSVNRSLAGDEVLFPFGQPVYVDATHDTVMSSGKLFALIASVHSAILMICNGVSLRCYELYEFHSLWPLTSWQDSR